MRYTALYGALISLVVTVRLLVMDKDSFMAMAVITMLCILAFLVTDAVYANSEAVIDAIYANADRTAAERQANTKHRRRYAQ